MRQHLLMGHHLAVCNQRGTEFGRRRVGVLGLRQFPKTAKEPRRLSSREQHALLVVEDPQRNGLQLGQLSGFLAYRQHRQLGLAMFSCGDARRPERAFVA